MQACRIDLCGSGQSPVEGCCELRNGISGSMKLRDALLAGILLILLHY